MINYFKKTPKDESLRKLSKFEKGCWIEVIDPSEKELSYLHKTFDLDKQNLISGTDKNEVPRVEFDDKDLYVILKIISPDDKKELHTFLIIITNDFVLTLSEHRPDFMEKIFEDKIGVITTQKPKCLLKLFSLINKDFERSTLAVVRSVNTKREAITNLSDRDIKALLEQESILNNFVSSYHYINLLYQRIVKNVKFFEEDKEFIKDLIIESQQGLDLCKSSLRTISNMRDHFVILLSNKLNRVITLLTIFTVFISVPAAISGIYGMNLGLPLQNNPFAFYYLAALIVVIWIGFIVFFKKNRIL
ncbi:MAG: magnesium transporter CorA family protein [Candidatus Woesearchaeota archaeon]|jgi:magnesium transporter|nr:magnesium transporter CorA family protein [Candidatus Woesearchaeota archaeon]MDP7506194.1 magnesium transporter CorA family protein [Candidatus Woesearchaeota archaeon]|tara:strand:+ start:379 stop:1290 length:912 start_codon:yes stop_codon:yes gene_type:complete